MHKETDIQNKGNLGICFVTFSQAYLMQKMLEPGYFEEHVKVLEPEVRKTAVDLVITQAPNPSDIIWQN